MGQCFHEWVMENRAPYRSQRGVHPMNVNEQVIEHQSLTFVGIKRTFFVWMVKFKRNS